MIFLVGTLAFVLSLSGFFAIRKFAWITFWAVCVVVVWGVIEWQMRDHQVYGMALGFYYVFLWAPSLAGMLLGLGISCVRITRREAAKIDGVGIFWAGGSIVLLIALANFIVSNL